MSRTTTILLLVGISGIIVYLLMREKKATGPIASTSYSLDLGSAINSFGGLFSKGDKAAPPGYIPLSSVAAEKEYFAQPGAEGPRLS